MTRAWLLLLFLPLFACGDDQRMPAGQTPPPPATTGGTSIGPVLTSDDTTATSPCACAPDQFCAAEYVPGDPEPASDAFTCQAKCLPAAAPGFWCFDDSSCCGGGTCRPDGLCGGVSTETDGSTTDATGSTTDATGSTTSATGSTTDATGSTTSATGSTTDATSTGSSTG